jgi:methionyl-tRNA formyltransferase
VSQNKLRLAFAGTPELASTVLKSLLDAKQHTIEVVLTQPDRPAGRGRKLKQSEVKQVALEHDIPVFQPEKSSELKAEYLENCDLMLVVAYGLLIKPKILAKPKLGCINIHTSLLPRWRGAAPIQRAIEAGDEQTGITFMQMDAGLDTGDILKQVTCPIEQSDTGGSLHDRLADIAAENINDFLTKVANQEIVAVKQDETHSNYANKISKQEAKIDWSRPAKEIEKKIRAFNPFPVTHTQINDLNIRIWDAEVKTGSENDKPGTILNNKSSLDIATGENILSITKLQSAGKRAMTAKEFLNGHADFFDSNPVAN